MDLPDPIARYFAADAELGGAAPVEAFAPDAEVFDEGERHRGREAIGAWWRAAKQKYRHRATPFEMTEAGGVTEVRAMVSGEFPGSPAPLRFSFSLADGAITRLAIGG